MGKISRRPTSMAMESTTLLREEKAAKLPKGPTASRPGPVLLMQARAAEQEVVREKPSRLTTKQVPPRTRKKQVKKTKTEFRVSSSTALPSSLTTFTARGWESRRRERRAQRSNNSTREALRPPAGLPAHPPRNISSTRTNWETVGQRAKSAVEKPVVETTEDT